MKLLLLCLSMTAIASMRGQSIRFQSSETQTSLLELYTSEGCSSCPPAENWLSKLKRSPRLWKDFAPLALHVDYWDYLGWRDPWAAKQFSDRQRTYASQWSTDNIYTPEFVLDGQEWRNWSGRSDGPSASRKATGVLTVLSIDTNHWAVTFAPTKAANGPYTIHAALLASGLISNVKAGENRGRRLEHDFVVLSLSQGVLTDAAGIAKGEFILARPPADTSSQLAVTAWVTQVGHLEPIQATGGWFETKTAASN